MYITNQVVKNLVLMPKLIQNRIRITRVIQLYQKQKQKLIKTINQPKIRK